MYSPLLLLHGALGSAEDFSRFLPELTAIREIYTFDFPGHAGKDLQAEEFSIEYFSRAVFEWLNEKNIPLVEIFGYSMGGYVALFLAAKHPERVKKVITLGTKFAWTPEIAAKELVRLQPSVIEAKVPAFAQSLAQHHGEQHWRQVVEGTAKLLTQLGEQPSLTEEVFNTIKCPVEICRGSLDQMVSAEECIEAAEKIPNAHYRELPDVKHLIEQLENQKFQSIIHWNE